MLASLYSALFSTITLNSVQTGIAARPVHTGPDWLNHTSSPRMQLHVPNLPWPPCPPKWEGQLGDVRSKKGEPCSFPKKVLGEDPGRMHTTRRLSASRSAHSTSATEQKEHSCMFLRNLLLFLDRKSRGIPNRNMEKKQMSLS